jgi:hypothetical protein
LCFILFFNIQQNFYLGQSANEGAGGSLKSKFNVDKKEEIQFFFITASKFRLDHFVECRQTSNIGEGGV